MTSARLLQKIATWQKAVLHNCRPDILDALSTSRFKRRGLGDGIFMCSMPKSRRYISGRLRSRRLNSKRLKTRRLKPGDHLHSWWFKNRFESMRFLKGTDNSTRLKSRRFKSGRFRNRRFKSILWKWRHILREWWFKKRRPKSILLHTKFKRRLKRSGRPLA